MLSVQNTRAANEVRETSLASAQAEATAVKNEMSDLLETRKLEVSLLTRILMRIRDSTCHVNQQAPRLFVGAVGGMRHRAPPRARSSWCHCTNAEGTKREIKKGGAFLS
jgi:hypothetical protein